tara:strand:- start:424 stop:573 length:150 start_codon:yes stop_codon:yes gene_type:complete
MTSQGRYMTATKKKKMTMVKKHFFQRDKGEFAFIFRSKLTLKIQLLGNG